MRNDFIEGRGYDAVINKKRKKEMTTEKTDGYMRRMC